MKSEREKGERDELQANRQVGVGAVVRWGRRGTIICTVFYASPMDDNKKWRKTGNTLHGKGLLKECACNIIVGYNYRKAVAKLTKKEMEAKGASKAEIEAKIASIPFGSRAWGVLRPDRKFVDHTDKAGKAHVYLSGYCRSATTPVYRLGKDVEDSAKVEEFLSEGKKSHAQDHLEGEVVPRDFRLDHILAIRYRGETILVSDLEPVTSQEQVDKAPKNQKLEKVLEQDIDIAKAEKEGEIEEQGEEEEEGKNA